MTAKSTYKMDSLKLSREEGISAQVTTFSSAILIYQKLKEKDKKEN